MVIRLKKNKPIYTISIAAEIIGCHPRTLRIYEEEGLISPSRTKTNIRRYSQEDIEQIQRLCRLMDEFSLNLSGVKAMFKMAEQFHIEIEEMFEKLLR